MPSWMFKELTNGEESKKAPKKGNSKKSQPNPRRMRTMQDSMSKPMIVPMKKVCCWTSFDKAKKRDKIHPLIVSFLRGFDNS